MRKMFLASYFAGAASLLPGFIGHSSEGGRVVFIPTASLPEKVTFYVDSDKKALAKLGLSIDELEISTAPPGEIEDKISSADYVFVEGGNTFFLLQEMRRTGADKLVIEHIDRGKLYIGSSAGSIIASKDIEYVKYMDDPAAAPDLNGDFSAFGVVDFCVVPHCSNFPFKKAAAKIIAEYTGRLSLCPISNDQAVAVDGDGFEVLTAVKKKKK
jgi:dipeptidase E